MGKRIIVGLWVAFLAGLGCNGEATTVGPGAVGDSSSEDFCSAESTCARPNDLCMGMRCVARSQTPGALAGPCRADRSCDGSLLCDQGLCVDAEQMIEDWESTLVPMDDLFLEESASEAMLLRSDRARSSLTLAQQSALLPRRVDLTEPTQAGFSPVPPAGSQGRHGSCTAWTLAHTIKSYQEAIERGWDPRRREHRFSAAYTYAQLVRGRNSGVRGWFFGQDECDRGSNGKEIGGIVEKGALPVAEFDYNHHDMTSCVDIGFSDELEERAEEFRIAHTKKIFSVGARGFFKNLFGSKLARNVSEEDLLAMKGELAAGRPLYLGIYVPPSFSWPRDSAGRPIARDSREAIVRVSEDEEYERDGGHAIAVIGYDDDRGTFTIQNSWGQSWGVRGRGELTYDTVRLIGKTAFSFIDESLDDNPDAQCPSDLDWSKCSGATWTSRCGDRRVSTRACNIFTQTCVDSGPVTGCISDDELPDDPADPNAHELELRVSWSDLDRDLDVAFRTPDGTTFHRRAEGDREQGPYFSDEFGTPGSSAPIDRCELNSPCMQETLIIPKGGDAPQGSYQAVIQYRGEPAVARFELFRKGELIDSVEIPAVIADPDRSQSATYSLPR